ncbi:MAG: cohesin domain-containing protein [Steroidobacteraceae bacterium]|jgi:hypothetical protein
MKLLSIVVLTAAAALPLTAAAQVLSIGSETVTAGGTATVDLNISGLSASTALGAYDINVGFNPGIVNFTAAAYGDPALGDQLNLEGFGQVTNTTPGTGTVDVFEVSLDSSSVLLASQAKSFTLATLTFNALTAGVSALDLSLNAVSDQNGNALTPSLLNGSITVSAKTVAAPEIGAAAAGANLTLLLGVLAVMQSRRRPVPARVRLPG